MDDRPDRRALRHLLQAALDEADAIGNTLVAALLAECLAAVDDRRRPRDRTAIPPV